MENAWGFSSYIKLEVVYMRRKKKSRSKKKISNIPKLLNDILVVVNDSISDGDFERRNIMLHKEAIAVLGALFSYFVSL